MAGDVKFSNFQRLAKDVGNATVNLINHVPSTDEFASYDVFISHRGLDTKIGFVSLLHKDLVEAGLRTFLDCNSIDIGEDSWECIEHSIKRTSIGVVVFSERFSKSPWCLKELHVMLHTPSVRVLPVFYNVQPWEVRFPESGQLKVGFEMLCGRHPKEGIDQWREDLGQVSKIMGWEHSKVTKGLEGDLVKAIVKKALELANKPLPIDVGEYVVGVEEVATEILQVLEDKERVLMLGLWGMGGIGKSTLARELYNRMRHKFGASCFIEDVQAMVKNGHMERVQTRILKDLCKESMEIEDMSKGKSILEERLSNMKFLLVLDNVNEDMDMYYCLSRKILGNGSMCIVTSRDVRVIRSQGAVDVNHEVYIHEVKGLSDVDAQRVFASFAFGGYWSVKEGFEELVANACRACHGVPLVVKVFGALLRHVEDVRKWKAVVRKLERGMIVDESKIFECLRISYDMLEENVKEMFLDIACVLLGESKDYAIRFWEFREYCAEMAIERLVERALITIDKQGCFNVHDHLRDMGRKIAKEERICCGVTRRLWMPESLKLLEEKEDFPKSLQYLMIHNTSALIELDVSHAEELQVFICHSKVNMRLGIPRNLRWFLGSIDDHLEIPQTNKLSILDLQWSRIKTLSKSIIHASELEVLNMSFCGRLTSLPHSFGRLKKLQDINLKKLVNLQSLPESFGELCSLEVLDMSDCTKLTSLPHSFGSLKKLRNMDLGYSGIQSLLPESFGELNSLEVLNMKFCEDLTSLPHSFGSLKKLRDINLGWSGVQSLPESFGELSSLEVLKMNGCGMSSCFPHSFRSYKKYSRFQSLPGSFGELNSLEVLDMFGCTMLTSLPHSFGSLKKLRDANLGCSGIQSLPGSFGELSSLEVLKMFGCTKLTSLPHSFGRLKKLHDLNLGRFGIQSLPESFGELNSLEVLTMCVCTKLTSLPYSFGSLKKLRYMSLGSSGIQSLPGSFGELSNLEVLKMFSCTKLTSLPHSFESLKMLRDMNLESSLIQSLPESFGELSNLEVLNMQSCKDLTSLPHSFGSLKKLRDANLGCSGIQSLRESLGELSSLKVLKMFGCTKLTSLPHSIGRLKKLQDINLRVSGIQSLPESFGELSTLEVLDMSNCTKITSLPHSFGSLKKLRGMDLQNYPIQSLPDSFGELTSLEVLNMNSCKDITSLPHLFGSLKKLRDVNLLWSGIQSLPESFGELSSLQVLNMSLCSELTTLPHSFGSLKKLRDMNLESSGIQSLPESFGELSSLEVLKMYGCTKLTSLPHSFGSLKKLQDVNLGSSGIQSLPNSFGELSSLEVLNMKSCEDLTSLSH